MEKVKITPILKHLADYILVSCLAILGLGSASVSQAQVRSCREVYNLKIDPKFLEPSRRIEAIQTVFLIGKTEDGRIRLRRNDYVPWNSDFAAYGDFSLHSDPRKPVYFFGSELATLLGFEFKKILNKSNNEWDTDLYVPTAERLGEIIKKVNLRLKDQGIARKLVSSGYLNDEDLLRMGAQGEGDEIAMLFPFSEDDPKLTQHEVAYHMGAILYSPKIIRKAAALNRTHLNFIQYLKSRAQELGPLAENIANQLLHERAFEMDVGTANPQSKLATLRSRYPGRTYKDLWSAISKDKDTMTELGQGFELLARPSFSPIQALGARLSLMTDGRVAPSYYSSYFLTSTNPAHNQGTKFSMDSKQAHALNLIFHDYIKLHPEEDIDAHSEGTPRDVVQEFVTTLDERIQNITSAILNH